MALNEKCKKTINGSTIKLKDSDGGPSIFRITNNNNSKISVFVIDNCQITTGERCDYLILPNERASIFVELKGNDVKKGISQIESTLLKLKGDLPAGNLYAVIVSTRCPLSNSEVMRHQDIFKRKYSCTLRVKSREYSCKTSDF